MNAPKILLVAPPTDRIHRLMDIVQEEGGTIERYGHVALARERMDNGGYDAIFVQEGTAEGDVFLSFLKIVKINDDRIIPFDWSKPSRRAA